MDARRISIVEGDITRQAVDAIVNVAFPSISTSAYRFPLDRSTRIALTETKQYLAHNAAIEKVVFVCFGAAARECYERTAQEVFGRE